MVVNTITENNQPIQPSYVASEFDNQATLQQHVITDSKTLQAECTPVEGGAVLVSLFDDRPFTAYIYTIGEQIHRHVNDIHLCHKAFTDGYHAQVFIWSDDHVFVLSNDNGAGDLALCAKCGRLFVARGNEIYCHLCSKGVA